jgi:hypothetical protein
MLETKKQIQVVITITVEPNPQPFSRKTEASIWHDDECLGTSTYEDWLDFDIMELFEDHNLFTIEYPNL